MFTKISGEFDSVEFAEYAARHIRKSADSPVRITIYKNSRKYKGLLKNNEYRNATHGNVFYLLPTAVTSYNYITASISRPVNTALISEPLLNEAATVVVQTNSDSAEKIAGIIGCYGGYNVRKT